MPETTLQPPNDFPPTDPAQLLHDHQNHQLAREFAQPGTVKHFALRLGYMPADERSAETILRKALREGEWWQEQAERLHRELEALRQQGAGCVMCPGDIPPRRRVGRALTEFVGFVAPSDQPPNPNLRTVGGIVFTTIADWYANGAECVRAGARGVSITDRSPRVTEFDAPSRGVASEHHGSRAGRVEAFGWQYGFSWLLDPTEHESAYWTLPQDVFDHLPDCQFPTIVLARARAGGCMPLWLTPGGAMAAMNCAAFAFALAVA